MNDENAQQLLARVMGWADQETVLAHVPSLQLLAQFKYDQYQRFGPGQRFVESLALWLHQFDPGDREAALSLVESHLVFFSQAEMSHLVELAYPDVIVPERMRMVAEEKDLPAHQVGKILKDPRFTELRIKSLYLGLSDGARTNELRRAADGNISNEQIWQAYELGSEKIGDMLAALNASLQKQGFSGEKQFFNSVWLLDDFSGSGNTYIRWDANNRRYKGKIKKIYEQLQGSVVDPSHYDVFLLLYVATRQAVEHIEYWSERFTSERGFKPLKVHVLCTIERELSLSTTEDLGLRALLESARYHDQIVVDEHFRVGGTDDARLGFAACALPVVLAHNTPNNSVYLLWGPEGTSFRGLFPRVSRHRGY